MIRAEGTGLLSVGPHSSVWRAVSNWDLKSLIDNTDCGQIQVKNFFKASWSSRNSFFRPSQRRFCLSCRWGAYLNFPGFHFASVTPNGKWSHYWALQAPLLIGVKWIFIMTHVNLFISTCRSFWAMKYVSTRISCPPGKNSQKIIIDQKINIYIYDSIYCQIKRLNSVPDIKLLCEIHQHSL